MEESITQPILSIVIPTKNRYDYLENFLSAVAAFQRNDFEIIIQDNSDNNNDFLKKIEKYQNDKRIKYYYDNSKLDVCANADLAINKANGVYVCFIGDDDGITEESISVCHWLLENEYDSANCCIAIYDWPDLLKKYYGYKTSGEVRYTNFSCRSEEIDPKEELIKILKGGAQVVSKGARLYQGIIKRSSLLKLKEATGTFFPGPVPDMSSAVGIVPYLYKHVYIDYPLIIAGSSGKSTAGLGAKKQHQGEIKDIVHLPKNTAELWSKEIPFYWSGPTIWAEGALQALKRTDNAELIKYYNFNFLLALCLVYDSDFRPRVLKHIIKNTGSTGISVSYIIFYILKIFFLRFKTLFGIISRNSNVNENQVNVVKLNNIKSTIEYFTKINIDNNYLLKIKEGNAFNKN